MFSLTSTLLFSTPIKHTSCLWTTNEISTIYFVERVSYAARYAVGAVIMCHREADGLINEHLSLSPADSLKALGQLRGIQIEDFPRELEQRVRSC